jgi:benzylsuccinate CoA-transferase BbsF subunit
VPDHDPRTVFAGLRVADFSWVGVGPTATQTLAMFGAEVIRVESATRLETARTSGPHAGGKPGADSSAYYGNMNRDKLGMSLNLRHPRAIEAAERLIAVSDVVTESFTPGYFSGLGFTYERIRQIRPDVIMLSTSMEGQDGPHSKFKGFGLTLQATAGITGLTGWPDRAPVGTGVAYTDWFATHFAMVALLAALEHRERTGEGQLIDLAQFEATVAGLGSAVLEYTANGTVRTREGNSHPLMAPHGVYPVQGKDRWIAIAVEDDARWLAFRKVMGEPPVFASPELCSTEARLAARDHLDTVIAGVTAPHDGETLAARLQEAGVAAHIVNTTADLELDPQLNHRDHGWVIDHPVIGPITWDAPAWKLEKTPAHPDRPAPLLGQHNEYIYRDVLGYTEEEFISLLADGVID